MKSIFLTITVFTMAVMFTACEKESDLSDELSAEDKIAVEGMEEALHTAEAYQDSLVWCDDPANNCDTAFVQYCDSLFHFGDAEYERHHDNYSHNNIINAVHKGQVTVANSTTQIDGRTISFETADEFYGHWFWKKQYRFVAHSDRLSASELIYNTMP